MWLSPSGNIYGTQPENVRRASGFEPKNVTFLTYTRLMLMSGEEIKSPAPTHAAPDEYPSDGAEHWEENLRRLMSNFPETQVLGLSAAPVRYLDNQLDMSEELLDGCVADSMSLGEAIARGILPAPKCVISLYTLGGSGFYEKEPHNYRDRIRRSSMASRESPGKPIMPGQAYFEAHGDPEGPPEYVAVNGTWLGKWAPEQ